MFMLITCKLCILVQNKGHVTSKLKTADITTRQNLLKMNRKL